VTEIRVFTSERTLLVLAIKVFMATLFVFIVKMRQFADKRLIVAGLESSIQITGGGGLGIKSIQTKLHVEQHVAHIVLIQFRLSNVPTIGIVRVKHIIIIIIMTRTIALHRPWTQNLIILGVHITNMKKGQECKVSRLDIRWESHRWRVVVQTRHIE